MGEEIRNSPEDNGVSLLSQQVRDDARLVYNYHRLHMRLEPADAIFCLCSLDTRIARYAAQLYHAGLAPLLIFSGDSGALTRDVFDRPEAEVFAAEARAAGVPASAVVVEPRARNTGENIRFTHELLLRERGLRLRSLMLVQKPYMERRTYATFMRQWPDAATAVAVTSPPLDFDEYPDRGVNDVEKVISIMVGDLVRIREYPKRGFQIEQEMPDDVAAAGERLIAAGYDRHLP
ncbi:Uncharacterized protein ESCO_003664 [Escovopsis weberi]|uniref:DUF218 domain-containing protein n=1 Tax=Escovopsis weberi TaxID=150374 RepID=A0A0M8N1Q1_ESCWE|nr:Uncharacterized protein ESCO_003664 [Escovopsis weberi]